MGSESWFVKLLPDAVSPVRVDGALDFTGRSAIRVATFRAKLLALPIAVRPVHHPVFGEQFVIESGLIVDIGEDDGWLQEMTLIGCFSWYVESLHIAFRLASLTHDRILPVSVFFPMVDSFAPEKETEFISRLRNVYDQRRDSFKLLFDGLHERILPFEFYKTWQRRRSWWWKLWSFAKRRNQTRTHLTLL